VDREAWTAPKGGLRGFHGGLGKKGTSGHYWKRGEGNRNRPGVWTSGSTVLNGKERLRLDKDWITKDQSPEGVQERRVAWDVAGRICGAFKRGPGQVGPEEEEAAKNQTAQKGAVALRKASGLRGRTRTPQHEKKQVYSEILKINRLLPDLRGRKSS